MLVSGKAYLIRVFRKTSVEYLGVWIYMWSIWMMYLVLKFYMLVF